MSFEDLDKAFGKLIDEIPNTKRKLILRCGDKMHDKVLRNIDISVKSGSGRLKSAVTKVIGTEGGYAAIKPNWKRAPHTFLIENGHKLIVGKGENQRFVGWVPGVHMYRNALNDLADELESDAEEAIYKLVGDAFD